MKTADKIPPMLCTPRQTECLHADIIAYFFFFNDTATTEIYTLSLHDALPISPCRGWEAVPWRSPGPNSRSAATSGDRKSTRLNSSHSQISYAVFCLKKNDKKGWHQDPTSCT